MAGLIGVKASNERYIQPGENYDITYLLGMVIIDVNTGTGEALCLCRYWGLQIIESSLEGILNIAHSGKDCCMTLTNITDYPLLITWRCIGY